MWYPKQRRDVVAAYGLEVEYFRLSMFKRRQKRREMDWGVVDEPAREVDGECDREI